MQKEILLEVLQAGIQEANLPISNVIAQQLIQYIELLVKWNSVHNLTAVRDPVEMIRLHVLDSLVVLPHLPLGNVLDVGTGAGLPGIPLALARPQQTFVLIDANHKKITFVQHVILSLKLTNVSAVCVRVESYSPPKLFPVVISRAFASLSDFVHLCGHLCPKEGRLLAMKGVIDPAEIAALSADYTIEKIESMTVPGPNVSRSLVFIAPKMEA